jgi:hypothetical protein
MNPEFSIRNLGNFMTISVTKLVQRFTLSDFDDKKNVILNDAKANVTDSVKRNYQTRKMLRISSNSNCKLVELDDAKPPLLKPQAYTLTIHLHTIHFNIMLSSQF